MKTDPVNIIKYLFSLLGACLLAGAFYLYHDTNELVSRGVRAQGVVIDLDFHRSSDSSSYRPVVQFYDRAETKIEFVSAVGSNPPSYNQGEKVEVLYNPANPQDAEINSFMSLWFATLIAGFMGVIFFTIGMGLLVYPHIFSRPSYKHLRLQGQAIKADVKSVDQDIAITINGRHPYRIVCQWHNPVSSEMHVFVSEDIGFDPSDYVKDKTITVYMDRKNPEKYWVDISHLPKIAAI